MSISFLLRYVKRQEVPFPTCRWYIYGSRKQLLELISEFSKRLRIQCLYTKSTVFHILAATVGKQNFTNPLAIAQILCKGRYIPMLNKHMRRCPNAVIIRKSQIKITMILYTMNFYIYIHTSYHTH